MKETVLTEVADAVRQVLDGVPLDEITMETSFADDLQFESIDVVVLSGHLTERYGDAVNVPKFFTDLELDEIIALTVGDLVAFISTGLEAAR
ncbi:acyl carrier protein [Lentzea sp. NBRC 105346]|nr:acyl carrier protein [Lentzea sp. NBRC 105346]